MFHAADHSRHEPLRTQSEDGLHMQHLVLRMTRTQPVFKCRLHMCRVLRTPQPRLRTTAPNMSFSGNLDLNNLDARIGDRRMKRMSADPIRVCMTLYSGQIIRT